MKYAEQTQALSNKSRDKMERMYAALNSGMNDLYVYNGRIEVTGKNKHGVIIELGSVSETVLYHKGINPIALIDSVRFARNYT